MPWSHWRMYCIRYWEDRKEFLTESEESVTIILVLYAHDESAQK